MRRPFVPSQRRVLTALSKVAFVASVEVSGIWLAGVCLGVGRGQERTVFLELVE